jgi:hypothetical protein
MMQTPPGLAFTLASKQALRVFIRAIKKPRIIGGQAYRGFSTKL